MSFIARLVLFFSIFQSSAFAVETIELEIDSFEHAFFISKAIKFSYAGPDSASPGISIRIDDIQSPYIDESFSIVLRCSEAIYSIVRIDCSEGKLSFNLQDQKSIVADFGVQLNLLDKSGHLHLSASTRWGDLDIVYRADANKIWQVNFNARDLHLSIFSSVLESFVRLFEGHPITTGIGNFQVEVEGLGQSISNISLNTRLNELSVDGDSVLEKVTLEINSDIRHLGNSWSFTNVIQVLDGEMYIQPGLSLLGEEPGFYIESADEAVVLRLAGNWLPEQGQIELQDFYYLHPDVITLQGSTRVKLAEELLLSDLRVRAQIPDLGNSYPVYIQPILLQTNFSNLELSGSIDLSLEYKDSELRQMELLLDDVYLDDLDSRFSISALNSRLALNSSQQALQSNLSWDGMSFYKLDFGPSDIIFESNATDVRVLDWQDVSILDGALKIDEFSMLNLASSDFELNLGGELKPISMQLLTHALGWTIFPGTLSGEISGLKYAHNKLQLEGDILISIFGGSMLVHELDVEDLFSTYSVLTTDIKVSDLDLEQITDVFTFGKIEGSLNGRIDKLKLEDWQPSYFEAEFSTPEDDDKPHRISQKALENLNELGGGLGGTLSQGFLRFLPAYSYGLLGISCRLSKGVCELGGVEDEGDSFSILTKGGFLPPWVEVKGAGRSIKWDDLLDGLKQIAEGEVSIE